MQQYTLILVLIATSSWSGLKAQDIDITPYLAFGQEAAQELTSEYSSPLTEGLMHGLAGGWSNSAETKNLWEIELSLKYNGSVIPVKKKSFPLSIEDFPQLEIVGGGNTVNIPTIFGSSDSSVQLAILFEDERLEFTAPTGIGLTNLNLLPNGTVQAEMGIGLFTEAKIRFVPRLSIQETKISSFGIGLQHQFSEWINGLKDSKIALSTLLAFSNFSADYEFESRGFVSGTEQSIDIKMNTIQTDIIVSTKNQVYNFYGAIGYLTGDSDLRLLGRYNVTIFDETTSFDDPIAVDRKVNGFRVSLGGKIRLARWLSFSADYTFQGYNNISLGLNFKIS